MFCFELLKFMLDILNSGGVLSFAERRLSGADECGGRFWCCCYFTYSYCSLRYGEYRKYRGIRNS